MERRSSWAAIMAIAALVTGACAPSASPAISGGAAAPAAPAAQAASPQGKVVVMGPTAANLEGLYASFTRQNPGVTVEPINARGPEMIARVDSEIASGQRLTDLYTTAQGTFYITKKAGRFEAYNPPNAADLPTQYRDPENLFFGYSLSAYGLLVNTDLVAPEDRPRSWKDLANPKLRGKILADDPRSQGGGMWLMIQTSMSPALGWDFVQSLKPQQIQFSREMPELTNQVARGQVPMAMPVPLRDYLTLKAKDPAVPVEIIFPEEGACICALNLIGLLKSAPHPDAAKLLMSFYFSDEAQAYMGKDGYFPTRPGQAGPAGYPPLSQMKLLPMLTDSELENLNTYSGRFEDVFFR